MKKLKNLGRSLGKQEQKKIIGGDYGDAACKCDKDGDKVAHCCEGHGACVDEAWGACATNSCGTGYYCRAYCAKASGGVCWM